MRPLLASTHIANIGHIELKRSNSMMIRMCLHVLVLVAMLVTLIPPLPASAASLTVTTANLPAGTNAAPLAVLAVSTTILPPASIGVPYSQTLTATGGTPPYTWAISVGALPVGLTLNTATGVISGTPTLNGSDFTVRVTDSLAATASRMISITLASGTLPGGTLNPTTITKYVTPLVIPPEMPKTTTSPTLDYYEIAVRQFQQQILPSPLPKTTVWSYGSVNHPGTFNYPAFTIEATANKMTQVKWINDLKDAVTGNFLPHLLPIDQTLHWANPPGTPGRDMPGTSQAPYTGPVPLITHVHGAHTTEESDGYPEAWYLPAASNIPAGYFTVGSAYDVYKAKAAAAGRLWQAGSALFGYPNSQRATTLWYHDHAMGMTRANVYAGPAGFYLIRGGTQDLAPGVLPGPAPKTGDAPGTKYYEIPIAIQDRSFNADGSLFYPDNRAFFEGITPAQLQIPFIPGTTLGGQPSDVSPIANPEFFGNTMVVNGNTWPYLNVEQRQYRFRLLNGSQARYINLKLDNGGTFYQIGNEGGFLPAPIALTQLLISPAERADVIVDFSAVPIGTNIIMQNTAPDSPFGGGVPGIDFPMADPNTTGQVMQFRVIPIAGTDTSTRPASLTLPAITALGASTATFPVSLNEDMSASVWVTVNPATGAITQVAAGTPGAMLFGPVMARLGTFNPVTSLPTPLNWSAPISERPALGSTGIFEMHNFTADAHPIHLHLVEFQVVERVNALGVVRPPEPWEAGFKDTVTVYPGEITRVKARFDIAGLYVWHCHIVEHEDNEMMRPYMIYAVPTVAAGPNATINTGATFTQSGSFSAPGLGPWTATVNYGDGTGVQPLTLNPNMAFALSHPYPTAGVYTVTVNVTDNFAGTGTGTLTVTVNAPVPLSVTTVSLPAGTVGTAYSQTLAATGGSGTGYTWAVTVGALPAGLTLNASTGVISGSPTAAATSNFTVRVTDSLAATATKAFSITVTIGTQHIPALSQVVGTDTVAYLNIDISRIRNASTDVDVPCTGGIGAYDFAITYPGGTTGNAINMMAVKGIGPFSAPTSSLLPSTSGSLSVNSFQTGSSPQAPLTLAQVAPRIIGTSSVSHNIVVTFNSLIESATGSNIPADASKTYTVRRGDAKADGVISITDALFIAQTLAGLRTTGENAATQTHAINGASARLETTTTGEKLNITDALFVAQMLAGLRDPSFNLV